MVYQKKSVSDSAYVDTTASVKAPATASKAEVKKLIDYFEIFDGSPEAAERFQQAFAETFHPDVLIELPGNNSLGYAAAVECIQAGIDKGSRADLLKIVENDHEDSATMTICNNVPGLKDDVTRQVAYFKDGKVIKVHAIEGDAAQFGNMVAAYQHCIPSSIADRSSKADVKKLVDYFAIFDGSPEAAKRFQQAFAETFHPDVLIELPGNDGLDYAAAVECIQAAADKGGRADLLNIVENDDGSATMTICNNVPGLEDDDVTRQVAHFKDGKVVKVHAIEEDAAQFRNMVAAIQRCIPSVADRYADMIACFDGSPGAYERASPIIDEICSPELIVSTGNDTMDLSGFKEWAASFGEQRNVAGLESIEPADDGIRVVIRNIVNGVDQGPVAQLGTVEDGKIVRWSADSKAEAGFDRLVTSVAANQDGMAGNVRRLRDYLAALDGSPGAFGRFEPHIDRVLSRDITWESGDGGEKMNYEEIIALLRDRYIPNGCYPVLVSVEVNEDGRSLTVVINNHLPGEDGDATRQVLYYGDDDRIERLVSTGLYDTCQRVGALPTK